ncbi:MAG: hypothetical protein WKG07_10495 [Hymenobacter sp.]
MVLTIHDLNFLHEKPDERTYARQLAMVRRNIQRADYLVTISDFVRQDVLRHADLLGYRGRQPLRYVRRGVEALAPRPPARAGPRAAPALPVRAGHHQQQEELSHAARAAARHLIMS